MRRSTTMFPIPALLLCAGSGLAMDHPMIGEPAPTFDLSTTEGGSVSLEDLRGKIVVLHFGAGW